MCKLHVKMCKYFIIVNLQIYYKIEKYYQRRSYRLLPRTQARSHPLLTMVTFNTDLLLQGSGMKFEFFKNVLIICDILFLLSFRGPQKFWRRIKINFLCSPFYFILTLENLLITVFGVTAHGSAIRKQKLQVENPIQLLSYNFDFSNKIN